MSQLMQLNAGPQKFVADCFLLLGPGELKACRLVCTTWSKFIQKEVWNNPRGKERLSEKLVQLWKTAHPLPKELGRFQVKKGFSHFFCDDHHFLWGLHDDSGRAWVYKLSDDQPAMTALTPGMARPDNSAGFNILAGSDGVLASVAWESIVTVWSTNTSPIKQLHCFSADSLHLLDASLSGQTTRVSDVHVVTRSKIAIVVKHSDPASCILHPDGPYFASLVVMEKVGSSWLDKILASFTSDYVSNLLSSDGDVFASFMDIYNRAAEKKVTLWHGDENGKDIVLPGSEGHLLAVSMKLPYLILGLNQARGVGLIKVYRVMTEDNPMEIKANAYLVKSIGMWMWIGGVSFISNKFFVGWVECSGDETIVNLFEKSVLLDPAVPPENTERRQVRMPGWPSTVKMNTTSLVSLKCERDEQGRIIWLLLKKNFWTSNNVV